jgi:hypothetical protein
MVKSAKKLTLNPDHFSRATSLDGPLAPPASVGFTDQPSLKDQSSVWFPIYAAEIIREKVRGDHQPGRAEPCISVEFSDCSRLKLDQGSPSPC